MAAQNRNGIAVCSEHACERAGIVAHAPACGGYSPAISTQDIARSRPGSGGASTALCMPGLGIDGFILSGYGIPMERCCAGNAGAGEIDAAFAIREQLA